MSKLYNAVCESIKNEFRRMPYWAGLTDVNISTTQGGSYGNEEVPCLDLWFNDSVLPEYDDNDVELQNEYNKQMNDIIQWFKDTWGIRLTDRNFDFNMILGIRL